MSTNFFDELNTIESAEDNEPVSMDELLEAYAFYNLAYPTTPAAVNEAFYNKQRQIREGNSSMQYTNTFQAKHYREILLANINTPIMQVDESENLEEQTEDSSDTKSSTDDDKLVRIRFKSETEPESLFINDDSLNPEEFVSWEDAIKVNTLNSKSQKNKKRKNKRRKKKRIFLRILVALLIIGACISIYTFIMVKVGVYIPPSNNLVYESLIKNGISTDEGSHILIDENSIKDLNIKEQIIAPYNQKAITIITANIETKLGAIKCKSYMIFDNEDGVWEYENQYADVEIISHDLLGTFEGPYKVTKDSSTTSTLTIELKDKISDSEYGGICYITAQNGKRGSYSIIATVNSEECTFYIKGIDWIEKPTFFLMEDFDCQINFESEELIPVSEEGALFELKRK